MVIVEPNFPDLVIFNDTVRVMQQRFNEEDPTGARFILRDRVELSVRSLQRARSELLHLLLNNRSATQVGVAS